MATTSWVGEVFDPDAPGGGRVLSADDDHWLAGYGGCDGVVVGDGVCTTERRDAPMPCRGPTSPGARRRSRTPAGR